MKKIFSILFIGVVVVSLMMVPAASVGADPGLGIVGEWHLDEGIGSTAADSSGYGNDGTLSGGKFGNALDFDGTNDYVNVPHDTTLNPTSAITVEAWAKLDRVDVHQVLVRKMNTYSLQVTVGYNGAGARLEGWVKIGGVWKGVRGVTGGTLLGSDQWYHFAFTYNGAQVTTYVNGVVDRSNNVIGAIDSTTNPLNIGRCGPPEASYCYIDGIVDEVRISDTVRYSAGFTPPVAPFLPDTSTVGLWHFDESASSTAYDETTNDNDGTIHGASWVPAGPTWTTGMFGNALSFDGDDFVCVPDDSNLDITSAITVEGWIKLASFSQPSTVAGKWKDISGTNQRGYLLTVDTGGRPLFYISTNGSDYLKAMGTALSLNTWYHLAGTYDGTNIKLYVNGTLVATTAQTGAIFSNNEPLLIGANDGWGGSARKFTKGMIDEVRIWDSAHPIYTLEVSPEVDFNSAVVDTEHTITASITPAVPGVEVKFDIIGPNSAESGTADTDSSGVATFTYTSNGNAGQDTILVWIDQDWDAELTDKDVSVGIKKYWLEHFVTGGGLIETGKGKSAAKITFGGNVGFALEGDPVGQWHINFHNVKGTDLDKGKFHTTEITDIGFFYESRLPPASPPDADYNYAHFNADGTFNGEDGWWVRVNVTDCGEGKMIPLVTS